jgi:hypothetical protein
VAEGSDRGGEAIDADGSVAGKESVEGKGDAPDAMVMATGRRMRTGMGTLVVMRRRHHQLKDSASL